MSFLERLNTPLAAAFVLALGISLTGVFYFFFPPAIEEVDADALPEPGAKPYEATTWEPEGCLAPDVDFLGYSDAISGERFGGTKVGGLSGLTYAPSQQVYYAVVDSGVGSTPARFYTLRVSLEDGKLAPPSITGVTELSNAYGEPFKGADFDGEDIASTKEGNVYIVSETEPSIRRFSPEGRLLAEVPIPQKFLVEPKGYARNNATLESLALSPNDNRSLFIANEEPLTIDGPNSSEKSRPLRIVRYEARGPSDRFEPVQEYFYITERGESVGAIAALSGQELLVLERGARQIFRVSLDEGVDVSDKEDLSATQAKPLQKDMVVDLNYCEMPRYDENPYGTLEGMALGPELPGKRRMVLVLSDDDFNPEKKTRLIALSIPAQ